MTAGNRASPPGLKEEVGSFRSLIWLYIPHTWAGGGSTTGKRRRMGWDVGTGALSLVCAPRQEQRVPRGGLQGDDGTPTAIS